MIILGVFIVELMFSKILFFLVIDEWNKLKIEIRNVESFPKFRRLLLNLDNGRPSCRPIYNIFNPLGVKYLTRLHLDLSHLNGYRFNHNFHTVLTLCVAVVMILNLILTFSFIAAISLLYMLN